MVQKAVTRSNNDVGGEVIEMGETEFMIRGLGYIKGVEDLKTVAIGVNKKMGTPIYVRDVADVALGPLIRRGLTESNGEGEVVTSIVVMRSGQNALKVIEGVKKKLDELKAGLPPDVKITPAYDRSGLIERAIENLRSKLLEECAIVVLVSIVFLLHFRSALVAIFTLPTAILIAFVVMRAQGVSANIMSLGGIAIAIGAMVDAAIIMIENAHKHIEHEAEKPPGERREHWQVILDASKEVGPCPTGRSRCANVDRARLPLFHVRLPGPLATLVIPAYRGGARLPALLRDLTREAPTDHEPPSGSMAVEPINCSDPGGSKVVPGLAALRMAAGPRRLRRRMG
jgi:Cu(I)/Ag(I) efflux system membrane protein CusA/SilA